MVDLRGKSGRGMNTFKEVGAAMHEGVAQAKKVGAVLHFLCKNIGWIAFSVDMGNCDGTFRDPFTSDVLFEPNMTIAFRCQIVAPFDASVVVLKDGCSDRSVGDGETAVSQVQDHVSCIDSQTRRHVCCANLCVTGTERCAVLMVCFPCDGATRSKENRTAHAAKFT